LSRSCETLIKGDQSGLRLAQLIDWLQRWTLDLQLVCLGAAPRSFPELQTALQSLAPCTNDVALAAFPEVLLEARRLSAHPLNIRLFLESLFSRAISLFERSA
jgi:DNA polymerase-3 subunit delta'